ncbi:MAG: aminotransferase class I/II-fold pyridoxal phosphate-dependent enzyme [Lachnospiraceae bacterium]|nr:aminotransferase class I/II-fold pyridoxal phosphate-dependent enzyme [Lachnospiraceae bacterium]
MAHGGDIYRNKVHMDFSVNLNPMGTPKKVKEALQEALKRSGCYPDPEQEAVRHVISETLGLLPENVIAASGASALLMAAVRAIAPGRALLFEPSFSGYRYALSAAGCEIEVSRMGQESGFSLTTEALSSIREDIDLIFVCEPASPSGALGGEGVITQLLSRAAAVGATVILDESFYQLSDAWKRDAEKLEGRADHAASYLQSYENLIIIRSLTKTLALPGIRIGYALSERGRIQGMKEQLPQWDLSVMGEEVIMAGMRTLYEGDYLSVSIERIQKERRFLEDGLRDMGLFVFASNAPYLLLKGPKDLYQKLLQKGILIRDCSDYEGLGSGYFRIAVRQHAENEVLLQTIRGIIDAR